MVFTAHIFVFYFLPLTLLGYYALPRGGAWRNAWLLAASYIFYGWWNPWFIPLMMGVTALTHFSVRFGSRMPGGGTTAAVIGCLLVLGFFKYGMFFQENANAVLGWFGAAPLPVLHIILPVGISFYTFQAISYALDVRRGAADPARSFTDYACYIALFPQAVAGPIIRYETVAAELVRRTHRLSGFSSGAVLFMLGFAKKVLLADPLGGIADAAFGAMAPGPLVAWFGALAYALQIYFDFCGYSDMAVGLGRMFGFEFIKNFDAPYRSESIGEFWRRWHISLSRFLRDYLYIPLGGNRRGSHRTALNIATVMLFGGLWHGANWTFVAWGAWHGGLLIAERLRGDRTPVYAGLPGPFRVGITFALVLFSWVIFRSASLPAAFDYFREMFGHGETDPLLAARVFAPEKLVPAAGAIGLLAAPVQAHDWSLRVGWAQALMAPTVFLLALFLASTRATSPFLYFQF